MPEYRAWALMKSRCDNPNVKCYERYGARGITYDPRWASFKCFYEDMGPKPSKEHSLDRIDFNGPYSKENCRWATVLEQANNKRNNRFLTYQGKTLTMAQWAREIGLAEDALEQRLRVLKWPVERALSTPHRGWGPKRPRAVNSR